MPAIFIVAPGHEFNYPADEVSLKILKNAGGRSKLKEEEKPLVKYKTVKEGQDCSDLPVETRDLYESRGWVIRKEDPKKSAPVPAAVPAVTEKEGD